MSKHEPSKLSKKHRDALLKELARIIFNLKTSEDVCNFLRDLLSESEELMLARRLQIVKMLIKDYTYYEIRNKLKVGYENIKSVKHFLDFGWGGYLKAVRGVKTDKK